MSLIDMGKFRINVWLALTILFCIGCWLAVWVIGWWSHFRIDCAKRLFSLFSVKTIFLKIEHFLCLLKLILIWISLHKVNVFFWTKCFSSYRLKELCPKQGNKLRHLLIIRQIIHFLPLIYAVLGENLIENTF